MNRNGNLAIEEVVEMLKNIPVHLASVYGRGVSKSINAIIIDAENGVIEYKVTDHTTYEMFDDLENAIKYYNGL